MACDAFGEAFKKRFGNDFAKLSIGDTVWFVSHEEYSLDAEGKYAIISDQDIRAFERG